jgi:hypothetical protein
VSTAGMTHTSHTNTHTHTRPIESLGLVAVHQQHIEQSGVTAGPVRLPAEGRSQGWGSGQSAGDAVTAD